MEWDGSPCCVLATGTGDDITGTHIADFSSSSHPQSNIIRSS